MGNDVSAMYGVKRNIRNFHIIMCENIYSYKVAKCRKAYRIDISKDIVMNIKHKYFLISVSIAFSASKTAGKA